MRKSHFWPMILIVFLTLLFLSSSIGAVPRLINYQGMITDSSGEPISDLSLSMSFKIYDSRADGNLLWNETQTVAIQGGIYNLVLGSVATLPDDIFKHDVLYLEIWVEKDPSPMLPRQMITSVAFSMRAGKAEDADTVDGKHASAFAATSHSHSSTAINSGALSTDRFSAFADLGAENYLGDANGDLAQNNGTLQTNLNADLLDGNHASAFASNSHTHFSLAASDGTPADAIYVNPTGYVGIGKTNPKYRLDVDGKAAISQDTLIGSQSKGIRMRTSGNLVDLESLGKDLVVNSNTGQNTLFNINTGNVGIGIWAPDEKLVVNGNLKVVGEIHIMGGADLAEPFYVNGQHKATPGMVVSIDPAHPGQLRLSTTAYDRMVAGVISGAKDLKPGMVMTKEDSRSADKGHPVALTGRVWCWCDTKYGKVTPGDLLTTSETPGHAMRVSEHSRAQGAVLGKAMSPLDTGQGLVLVLVTLQ